MPDLAPSAADLPAPLAPFAGAVLVDARVGGRAALPGAWVHPELVERAHRVDRVPVRAEDLRFPAVVAGQGSGAALHWGETAWPLPASMGELAVPDSCRAGVHSLARLRRLLLVATGRRDEVALTLWRDPGFEVPWHDVRLVPHARAWFETAQVPPDARYADAARLKGTPPERFAFVTG